jgi:hypothetical protein
MDLIVRGVKAPFVDGKIQALLRHPARHLPQAPSRLRAIAFSFAVRWAGYPFVPPRSEFANRPDWIEGG